jgi:hypothetical protein
MEDGMKIRRTDERDVNERYPQAPKKAYDALFAVNDPSKS